MSHDKKPSNANDEAEPGKSGAERPTDQQSPDAIRHQQDALHHKGTQRRDADGEPTHRGGPSK
jgi:hypothetical protein